ncbi:MAG: 1-acyl-sn-glycerol-3-phosphate acyltransferase [Methylobacteriaceae bacterium]|nr:1-acyl-sn-glycerol-3-phosphate acyltransferase [Methylobacteriaceae bacterium]
MTYLRGILALAGFALLVLFALPLQWLARRCNWPLQHRLPLLFCRVTCGLLGIRPRFHGRTSGRSPHMIVPNHVSWTDVLVLGCRQAPLRFVAKSEVAGWPLFGAIARLTGTVFLERQRRRSILRVNGALSHHLGAGEDVVVFAEATTGDGSRLKRFKAPHFAALHDFLSSRPQEPYATVTPVGMAYVRRHGLPLGRHGRAEVAWYGDSALLPHLWMLVTRGGIDCEVTYGAPIRFHRDSDRKAVARDTEAAVRALVNGSLTGRVGLAEEHVSPEPAVGVPRLQPV